MGNEFVHRLSLDDVNDFACSFSIHEVTHVNTTFVDEHLAQLWIFHHIPEKTGCRFCVCPSFTLVLFGMIEHINGVKVVFSIIESESEVGILDDETPDFRQARLCVIVVGTPENDVVAWEVDIAVEEVHNHDIQIFADIHPLLVFGLGMALLAIEGLEGVIECGIFATFKFLDKLVNATYLLVRDFYHVDVLKTIVVAVDIVFVRTLTDVQHAHVFTIDVEYG